MDRIKPAGNRERLSVLVKTSMDLRVPVKGEEFCWSAEFRQLLAVVAT